MPEAIFPVEVVSGVPVVTAPEEIDITNAAGLRAALLESAAHGSRTLVVDMAQTQFCDSVGLNVLVRAHKRAQDEGGELLLVICAAAVHRIFAVTGIDHLIPSFPNLGQALARTPAVTADLAECCITDTQEAAALSAVVRPDPARAGTARNRWVTGAEL